MPVSSARRWLRRPRHRRTKADGVRPNLNHAEFCHKKEGEMDFQICSNCKHENRSNVDYCTNCGAGLKGTTHETSYKSQPRINVSSFPQAISPPVVRDYSALRGIATLCRYLGWLIIVFSGLGVLRGLFTIIGGSGFLTGAIAVITAIVGGGLLFVVLRVIAESISVLLDIEANTRQVAVNAQRLVAVLEQRVP